MPRPTCIHDIKIILDGSNVKTPALLDLDVLRVLRKSDRTHIEPRYHKQGAVAIRKRAEDGIDTTCSAPL